MYRLFVFISLICISTSLAAQTACDSDRYKARVFSSINITPDIQFAQAQNITGFMQNLELDFYEPAGDTILERPLVLWFYGGGFEIGDKQDDDMKAWCDSLAHYGYATAAVNYRLGLVPTVEGGERAIYRSLQDGRAAVRFFKEFATTYRIDTNRIYSGGNSAGAFISLHLAFGDKESERPASTYNFGLLPDLGCLDCSGNAYNHTVEIAGIIDLWGAIGDTAWMEPGDDTPIILIHGTNDGIVPFDQGPPFSWPTFPDVYGSVRVAERATQLGIYHEFYPYSGEPHAFYGWGTTIITFPNQFWVPIFQQGRDFLLTTMTFETGQISGQDTACEGSLRSYSVSNQAGSNYCWTITGGNIISAQTNLSQILVEWPAAGQGSVAVTRINKNGLTGTPSPVKQIFIRAKPLSDFQYIQVDSLVVIADQSQGGSIWATDFGDGTVVSGLGASHIYTDSGTYTIAYIVANSCGIDTSFQTVFIENSQLTSALDEPDVMDHLLIYPNPLTSEQNLTIDLSGPGLRGEWEVLLLDLSGRTIKQSAYTNPGQSINLSLENEKLPQGLYLLQLKSDTFHYSQKILIKE